MASSDESDEISLTSTNAMSWDEEDTFQVEEILAEKEVNGRAVFLVKWEDWSPRYNTWEPLESFSNDVPLNQWKTRKRLIDIGYEEPFDVERWERQKLQRRASRVKKREHLANKRTPSAAKGPDAGDSDYLTGSQDSRSSSDDEKVASGSSMQRRGTDLKKISSLSDQDLTNNETSEDDMPLIATIKSKPSSKQSAKEKQSISQTFSNAATPQATGIKRVKPAKSSNAQLSLTREVPASKLVTVRESDDENPTRQRQATERRSAKPQRQSKALDKARSDDGKINDKPDYSQKDSSKPSQQPSNTGTSSILSNWRKEIDNSRKPSKNSVYNSFSNLRRAELRGRAEPPPRDPSELDFIGQARKSNTISGQQAVVNEDTQEPFLGVTNVPAQSIQLGEQQNAVSVVLGSDTTVNISTDGIDGPAQLNSLSPIQVEQPSSHPTTEASREHVDQAPKTRESRQLDSDAVKNVTESRPKAAASKDRGVAADQYLRRAVAIPFDQIHQKMLAPSAAPWGSNHVYGHLRMTGELTAVELRCNSSAIKYLVLEVKRNQDVLFDLNHSITAEEYKDLLHKAGNVYFGGGQADGRFDKSRNISSESAVSSIQRLTELLSQRRSGALFNGPGFCIVFWPRANEEWNYLNDPFAKDAAPAPLRFLVRKPLQRMACPDTDMRMTLSNHDSTTPNYKRNLGLMRSILGFNFKDLHIDNKVKHIFLFYPQHLRREHDLICVFAKQQGLQLWTALSSGHWHEFASLVAGRSGMRAKHSDLDRGVILAHVSFQQFRFLPRFFRLLERDVRVFTVDCMQNAVQQIAVSNVVPSRYDLIRQAREVTMAEVLEMGTNWMDTRISWTYKMSHKKKIAEVFPYCQGQALLLLDSFFVNNPLGVYQLLTWWEANAAAHRRESWRFVVRPHIHNWIREVIDDLKDDSSREMELHAWKRIGLVVDRLVPWTELDEQFNHEVADPDTYPKIISYPRSACPDLDFDYPINERGRDQKIARANDEILFTWFASWTLDELRLFRRFHAISGERDPSEYIRMHDNWARDWRYVSFGKDSDFLEGNKINMWHNERDTSPGNVENGR